jgi:hypothetical protein
MTSLSFPEYRSAPAKIGAQRAQQSVRVKAIVFMAKAFTFTPNVGQQISHTAHSIGRKSHNECFDSRDKSKTAAPVQPPMPPFQNELADV